MDTNSKIEEVGMLAKKTIKMDLIVPKVLLEP